MSVLSAPVAYKLLIDKTAMMSHKTTVALTSHPSVVSHVVSTNQRVKLTVHPIFLAWKVSQNFQRKVLRSYEALYVGKFAVRTLRTKP